MIALCVVIRNVCCCVGKEQMAGGRLRQLEFAEVNYLRGEGVQLESVVRAKPV
jgi:hypothetical protein